MFVLRHLKPSKNPTIFGLGYALIMPDFILVYDFVCTMSYLIIMFERYNALFDYAEIHPDYAEQRFTIIHTCSYD